jgi:uncharacterized protein YlxW (UPF0749 family)
MTRRPSGIGLSIVLAIFGFLVVTGLIQERLLEEAAPERRQELVRLVEQRQGTIRQLSMEVQRLSDRVGVLQERSAEESGQVREIVRRMETLRGAAGLEALAGPGVVVELTDSPKAPRTREELISFQIQDVDLQLVVNSLWAAGAEAVAVNGRRLVTTTAIRKAGNTILVNYRAVASPYRVAAIGDPQELRSRLEASEIGERFEVWRDVYGLGFSITDEEGLSVPALDGGLDLRHARPAGEGA